MSKRSDPSRVAFGPNGGMRHRKSTTDTSRNGADRTDATADTVPYSPVPANPNRFSRLGHLILETLGRGVIALGLAGNVVDANPDAYRFLETDDSLRVRAGRLEFRDPGLNNRLKLLLSELALDAVVATGFVARLPTASGSRARRILVSPASARTTPTDIAVLVHLFDIRPGRVISHDVLCALYGLTCAEANVAVKLFAGLSVDQTADALELTVNTVRTHLKRIFIKCDVHSQGELLHLLYQGPRSL